MQQFSALLTKVLEGEDPSNLFLGAEVSEGRSVSFQFTINMSGGGMTWTPAAWRIKGVGQVRGYGTPNEANLAKHMASLGASMKPGGANAHLGDRPGPTHAEIVDTFTGKVVAKWDASKTEGIDEASFEGDRSDQDDILDGMSRALFVTAYADGVEDGSLEGDEAKGGEDWMDVAPSTGADAKAFAKKLATQFEQKNGMPLWALYAKARSADGKHREDPDPDLFGHYIVMRALGHGVSWEDDHPDIDIKYPNTEYNWSQDSQLSKLAAEEEPDEE
jgi:hypothetical protein